MRPLILAVAASILAALPATAGPWIVSGSLGAISEYQYDSPQSYGPTMSASLGAGREIAGGLSLRLDGAYFRYRRQIGLVAIPENPPSSEWRTIHFVPVALTLRATTGERGGGRTRGFAQVGPALVGVRFHETGVWRSGGPFYGTPIVVKHINDSVTRLVPGITAGLGLRTRTSDHTAAEWGLHYLASDHIFKVALAGDPPVDYNGLDAWTMTIGLSWMP